METDDLDERYRDLDNLFLRDSKFAPEAFSPNETLKGMLFEAAKVLVIGAGGLG